MNKTQKILLNLMYQLASKGLVILISFISVSITAKYLGAENYGILTTALVFTSFFAAFVDFGISTIILKNTAGNKEELKKLVSSYFGLSIVYSIPLVLVTALLGLVVYSGSSQELKLALVILPISLFFGVITSSFNALFQNDLKLGVIALADSITKIVSLVVILLLVSNDSGLFGFMLLNAFIPIVSSAIILISARQFGRIKPSFDIPKWKKMIREAAPIGLSVIIFSVYFKVDAFLLSLMTSSTEVGIYGLAYRVVEAISSFPAFFMAAAFASLAAAYNQNLREKFSDLIIRSLTLMLIVGFPLAVGGLILSGDIIEILGTDEYLPATVPLAILIAATSVSFINFVWGNTLIILGKQKFLLYFSIFNLTINIILNLILIPTIGITGAAIATLFTEVFATVGVYIKLRGHISVTPDINKIIRIAASSTIMGIAVWYLAATGFNTLLNIIAGALIYCVLIIIFRVFTQEDIDLVFRKKTVEQA